MNYKKLKILWKKRRALRACGMQCEECPVLLAHFRGGDFVGVSCGKGLW